MKKRFALAVIVTTAIALGLVGCGVKVTPKKWGRFLN